MASLRKSERLISSRGHGCFTISPLQLPATATRFPSHGSGRPGLELQTATKLSSAGFEPAAVLTFGLRVRRLRALFLGAEPPDPYVRTPTAGFYSRFTLAHLIHFSLLICPWEGSLSYWAMVYFHIKFWPLHFQASSEALERWI